MSNEEDMEQSFVKQMQAMVSHGATVHVELTFAEAFTLIANIQLALRHPNNTGASAEIAREAARKLQRELSINPVIYQVAEMGWDRSKDLPGESVISFAHRVIGEVDKSQLETLLRQMAKVCFELSQTPYSVDAQKQIYIYRLPASLRAAAIEGIRQYRFYRNRNGETGRRAHRH